MGQIQATISLYTLDRYVKGLGEDSIFSLMQLPPGIDKDTVTNNILLESMDFEAVYTDPAFLRDAISIWAKTNYRTFEKWYEAQQIEYEPLYNYDRYEEWTDKGTDNKTTSGGQTGKSTAKNNELNTSQGTQDHYVNPYDTQQLTQDEQAKNLTTDNINGTQFIDSQIDTTGKEDGTTSGEHKGHLWGNIGVTTSQQMLQSEYDIAEWNLVKHITDMFIQKFCIMVY